MKQKKRKVLFLTNIPSPYRVSFFNELGKKCSLTVTFEGRSATDRDSRWQYEKVEYFHAVFMKGIRTGTDHFFCPGILQVLKRKWDAIIVGTYYTPTAMLAIEYMRLYKIRFFIEADGGMIKEEGGFKYRLKKHFISSADGWFSSGNTTTEYLVYYGADKERCYKFPFTSLTREEVLKGGPPGEEDKKREKRGLGISEKYAILSVGRFSYGKGYGKGFDNLMRVAENADKNVGFYIVGDEPTDEFLIWKKEKKLTHVHFVPFQTKKELTRYYIAADIFVLLTRADVWGLSVNEAMANGLPVITTDQCVAGTELVENNKNGFIIAVDDWKRAAEYTEKLIYDQKMMRLFGKCSYEKICSYTIEDMSLAHLKVLYRK